MTDEYPHEQDLPENVAELDIITSNDIDPVKLLRDAYKADLEDVVIVGMGKDGVEYFASSVSDAAGAMFYLQRGIHKLNHIMDDIAAGDIKLGKP